MEDLLTTALEFLGAHGYIIVFAWMFADQAALPLPAIPLLVAAGSLASVGQLDPVRVGAVATLATLLADSLWYLLGRYGGAKAIGLVCKLSLEPDSCVTTTRRAFGRFGPATLVIAKYLPGVQTLAPASAGFGRAPWPGFLVLDLAGTLLFVVPFIAVGFYFRPQLFELLSTLSEIGGALTWLVVGTLSLYVGLRVLQWVVFFRGHRLRRLTPEDLNRRLESGLPTTVIDLRQAFDYELLPRIIPGSLRIPIHEVPNRHEEIPREHDIVLVCT